MIYALYSFFLFFFRLAIGALALFDRKIRRGIDGRKNLFAEIGKYYPSINPLRKRILIHVSSFGELEQAKPVIAKIKEQYPDIHLHLTFFSPSGYENAIGSYALPDIITYLPFDSTGQVEWFLDITKPNLVLFVRYDLWHNLVHELHDRNIPMMLISATFDSTIGKLLPLIQSLYRKTYSFMNTIFAVSEADKKAIEKFAIHAKEILITGDTRCDQVILRKQAIEASNENILPESVQQTIASENLKVILAGSTWENDERIILPILKKVISSGEKLLIIIAPHEVEQSRIGSLLAFCGSDTILLSKISQYNAEKIIIVDSIGKLFSLYRFASFAYIGGGFNAGVHNVFEPAVWGVPSIVGENHKRSKEIAALIGLGGVKEIHNEQEFEDAFSNWFTSDMARNVASLTVKNYVNASKGATDKIMKKIAALQW